MASSPILMFPARFLLDPPGRWRVVWSATAFPDGIPQNLRPSLLFLAVDDIAGTLVHLDLPGQPHRVWQLTGKRDSHGQYEGVWPD